MLSKAEIFFYLILLSPLLCKSENKTNTDLAQRILNGEIADQGLFPYEAFITYNNAFKCSGSIIHKHWILTAGHCVRRNETTKTNLKVHVGTTRFLDEGQIFGVKYFRGKWNAAKKWPCDLMKDIGLIRINGAIEFNAFAQRISLPDPDFQPEAYAGSWGTVSGWGTNIPNSTLQPKDIKLRFADLQIQDHAKCVGRNCTAPVKITLYCAAAAGVSTCTGDSGSPFVMDNIQIGMVSGSSCWLGNHVYMVNIAYFVPWIEEELSNYNDSLKDS